MQFQTLRVLPNFISSCSKSYKSWVTWFFDPASLEPAQQPGNAEDLEGTVHEVLTLNVLGAALIILAVLVPFIVAYPKFRARNGCYSTGNSSRRQSRIVSISGERFG